MDSQVIDSRLFLKLIRAGVENLSSHAEEVNDLNVFPIPDGDTGSNMLLTMQGGLNVSPEEDEGIGALSRRSADGMLFSAKGHRIDAIYRRAVTLEIMERIEEVSGFLQAVKDGNVFLAGDFCTHVIDITLGYT